MINRNLWTKSENELLLSTIENFKGKRSNAIQKVASLLHRSECACSYRYYYLTKKKKRKETIDKKMNNNDIYIDIDNVSYKGKIVHSDKKLLILYFKGRHLKINLP